MKRPTLLFAIALLSLFLSAAFPAGASSLAADRPLQSSRTVRAQPAQVINTLPEGFHESHFEGPQNQFSCFAGGWAADPDDRSADLNIRVFSDNIEVVQTVANLFRQDLYDAGVCGDGTCNFIVDLWGLIAPGVDHSITVQAQDAQTGEWVDLSLTPRTLNCFEENVAPEGFHDFAEGTQNAFSCEAKGWAADPNDRDIDLNVRILSDGVEVAQTVADTFGEGLDEAGACPGGTCRFNVNLWGLISPDTDHLITVQAQDAQSGEWVDLSNTPKTLNCSSAPEGFHDFAEGTQNAFSCVAEGWAADPNDRNIDLNVRILSDGVEVAQTVAGTFREGLEEAGACPGGTCSFSVNLFSLISPDTDHSIAVQAQDAQSGEWVDLSNTPKMLNCIDAGAQPIVWDGFGNPVNSPIEALEVFKGKLYAEATNYEEGATLWRSDNGESWTQVTEPGFDSAYGANNPIVFDMFVFQNQLYAGTGNWTNTTTAGQIWRSSNGTTWSLVAADGLDDPNNTGFTTFASFNGMIYAAALNGSAGAEIWRSSTGGNGDWQQVVVDGFGGGPAYFIITSLTTFNDQLYATVEATLGNGAQVWRSANGTSWTQVSEDGFGDIDNYQTGASAVFRGQLYVTTRNDATGAQLWRTINGTTWQQVVGDGFGDVNNLKIESLVVYNGALYAAANNPVSGVELWRSSDGVHWTQVNADGFGDSGIFVSLWSNGTTVFQGNLLIGSNGPFGGVIWQLEK